MGPWSAPPRLWRVADFDGDGDVDKDDAQALLDYVTGARSTISSLEHADVSGDEDVDTYDVHVFLAKLSGGAVNVPAGGSVKVTVTLTLDAGERHIWMLIIPTALTCRLMCTPMLSQTPRG